MASHFKKEFVQAEIDGEFIRTRFADFTGPERSIIYETQYGAELQLTYLIFDFGQNRTTSEAALQSLYNADWSHNRQIQKTIQTLMNDYYNYLYQKELLSAAEQDVFRAKVSLDATQERFDSGLADVFRRHCSYNELPSAKTEPRNAKENSAYDLH